MTPTFPSGPAFLLRLLRSILTVVREHAVVLVVLSVSLHFVTWEFITDLTTYLSEQLGLTSGKTNVGPDILDTLQRFITYITYFALLQIAVAPLIFTAFPSSEQPIDPQPNKQELTGKPEFIMDLVRSLGILIVFLVATSFITVFGMFVTIAVVDEIGSSPDCIPIVLGTLLILFPVLFLTTRLSIAIPMAIIENFTIAYSLMESFRITKPYWRWLFFVILLILPVELGRFFLAEILPPLALAAYTILLTAARAVLFSVCYYHLAQLDNAYLRRPSPAFRLVGNHGVT